MAICRLCGNTDINIIHKGTRDRKDVDVLKCLRCGLVFLSNILTDDNYYASCNMRSSIDFENWRKITHEDDLRRVNLFTDLIKDRSIMDFGCGNGGFIELAQTAGALDVTGIEHDKDACMNLQSHGVVCYQDIAFAPRGKTCGSIFMFHVIEHLPEPEQILREVQEHMSDDSVLVIETPNANDALLSIYECKAFADFTYWSPHIYLYDESTLKCVLKRAGMEVIETRQLQRYPLANHLRWLAKGLPGGGVEDFKELNKQELNDAYAEVLRKNKVCDTLMCVAKIRESKIRW